MPVNGVALATVGIGAVFVYGGLTNKSPLQAIQYVIQGQSPKAAITGASIVAGATASSSGGGSGSDSLAASPTPSGSGQAALQAAAAKYGWNTGAEWQALNNIEMNEAGYSSTVANSSSGALGMAQALGHGTSATQGSLGNEYGGYGLTTAQAIAANSGDAGAQALWMVNYIKSRYGDPVAAWAQYHHPDGSKWY
jgi:hypothetical protein